MIEIKPHNPLQSTVKIHKVKDFHKVLGIVKEEVPSSLRSYDHSSQLWIIPRGFVPELADRLRKETGEEVIVHDIPGEKKVVDSLPEILRPYQREGIEFLVNSHTRGVLLADEMGLGKTVQALLAARAISKKILIMCPSFLRSKWASESVRWLGLDPQKVSLFPEEDTGDILILGYGMLSSRGKKFDCELERLKRWAGEDQLVLILDESHYLKNKKSIRTKVALRIIEEISPQRIFLLSGTPITKSSPHELLTIFQFMGFCGPGLKRWIFDYFTEWEYNKWAGKNIPVGLRNTGDFQKVFSPIFLRRTIDQVASDLPKIIRDIVPVPVDESSLLKIVKSADIQASKLLEVLRDFQYSSAIASSRRALGGAKVPFILDAIKGILDSGATHVVGLFEHLDPLHSVAQELRKDVDHVYIITGQVPTDKRDGIIQEFKEKGGGLLAINSAISVGLDIDFCHHVVMGEFPWSPSTLTQVESRFRRLTSSQPVHIQYVVGRGIELNVLQSLLEKLNVLNDLVGGFSDRVKAVAQAISKAA